MSDIFDWRNKRRFFFFCKHQQVKNTNLNAVKEQKQQWQRQQWQKPGHPSSLLLYPISWHVTQWRRLLEQWNDELSFGRTEIRKQRIFWRFCSSRVFFFVSFLKSKREKREFVWGDIFQRSGGGERNSYLISVIGSACDAHVLRSVKRRKRFNINKIG